TSCQPVVGAVAYGIELGRWPCAIRSPSGTSQSASAPTTPIDATNAATAALSQTTAEEAGEERRCTSRRSAASSALLDTQEERRAIYPLGATHRPEGLAVPGEGAQDPDLRVTRPSGERPGRP